MFKISPNQAPIPTGFLRGASLGTLLESATEGRSKCNHLHQAGLGKVQKGLFFSSFLNTHGRPSRNPWGWMPIEGGRMFPAAPELTPRPCAALGLSMSSRRPRAAQAPGSVSEQPVLGSTVPPESGGTPEPWERRKGNVPQKRAAWQRRLSGHPSGTACSQLGQRHSEAPSEAITGGRNSDLVQGNSVFPQCCVARVWVV